MIDLIFLYKIFLQYISLDIRNKILLFLQEKHDFSLKLYIYIYIWNN